MQVHPDPATSNHPALPLLGKTPLCGGALATGNQVSHVLDFHKVPFGYCWSEALVPKPPDWGDHIDVVGFFNLAEGKLTSYQPSPELAEFLAEGDRPAL